MTHHVNELGQPIGHAIEKFSSPARPNFPLLSGNFARLELISKSHLSFLYDAFSLDSKQANWTYLPYGPFKDYMEFSEWAEKTCFGEDPKFYTIFLNDQPAGYLRIEPTVGCIEIGHIHLSPLLQKKREGTEALILMIEGAFKAGYRRLEWKCDALNALQGVRHKGSAFLSRGFSDKLRFISIEIAILLGTRQPVRNGQI